MRICSLGCQDPEAIELIHRTFFRFEAPEYPIEGVKNFEAFLSDPDQMKALEFFGAFEEDELLGVIAAKENCSHVCLFFVEEKAQGKGVGRYLWEHLQKRSQAHRITVNSSPYAVEIYRHLGFRPLAEEQLSDGIRYTPMEYVR